MTNFGHAMKFAKSRFVSILTAFGDLFACDFIEFVFILKNLQIDMADVFEHNCIMNSANLRSFSHGMNLLKITCFRIQITF